MNDDFNTLLNCSLFEAVNHINAIKDGKETISWEDKQTF